MVTAMEYLYILTYNIENYNADQEKISCLLPKCQRLGVRLGFVSSAFLARKSAMAALIASSVRMEQWILTGGSSVLTGDLNIANVFGFVDGAALNHCGHQRARSNGRAAAKGLELGIFDDTGFELIRSCELFMTSPRAGAPTRPVPTLSSLLSSEPAFWGFSKWLMSLSLYAMIGLRFVNW